MNTRRRLLVPIAAAALCLVAPIASAFDHGADLSSLPRLEAHGARFHDATSEADAMSLLQRVGVDAVRLRLWHTPADSTSALPAVLAMARRAHALGMRVLLDLHYSDTWADRAHQEPPLAWRGLAFKALCDSTERWTRDVVHDFAAQGTPPALVQIGNEIDHGMLGDAGRLTGDESGSWNHFATLLTRASRGVHTAGVDSVRVLVHVATGGDSSACRWFFDHLLAQQVPFDAIGVSYYPLWHGGIPALRGNLAMLARRYRRPVYVVETAYPWTLRWFDDERNIMGDTHALLPGLEASPDDQATFLRAVESALQSLPDARGGGVYWWEPAWVAAQGERSPWENCTLFDSTGTRLPAARILGGR